MSIQRREAAPSATGRSRSHSPLAQATASDGVKPYEQASPVAQKIWTLSSAISEHARDDYLDYMEVLAADRAASAGAIAEAFNGLPHQQRFGFAGRTLIYSLVHVAHRDSIPLLQDILAEALPAPSGTDELIDERANVALTQSTAIRALHAIASRYDDPEVVSTVVDELEAVLANAGACRDVKLSAADVLLTHAEHPKERTEELAKLMGSDGDILRNLTIHPAPSRR